MEQQLEQIAEQQKQTWNKFSSGWRKWDEMTMGFLKPIGDEIIRTLNLKDTDQVLDIAAGTGEPGLSIARIVTKGKVVITDIADGMLDVTRENIQKKGFTNVETIVCDVSEMPFEDATFDAISCRLGFMFFPDMLMAAKEMVRVLKPGGRIATAVWGTPEKNFHATSLMGIISKNMEVPKPAPGAPGMFRCAKPGLVAELFKEAGLINVAETEVYGKMSFDDKETYWSFSTEVAAPVVNAMSKADEELKEKIKKQAFELMDETYGNNKTALDYYTLVIFGEKSSH